MVGHGFWICFSCEDFGFFFLDFHDHEIDFYGNDHDFCCDCVDVCGLAMTCVCGLECHETAIGVDVWD